MEKVGQKYITQILGVNNKTPGYIGKEDMKRKKRYSANVEKAMGWEDRMRKGKGNSLLQVFWKERRRDEEHKKQKWRMRKGAQIDKCRVEEKEIDKWIENKEPWIQYLKEAEEEKEASRKDEKIGGLKFNSKQKEIRTRGIPKYVHITGKEKERGVEKRHTFGYGNGSKEKNEAEKNQQRQRSGFG